MKGSAALMNGVWSILSVALFGFSAAPLIAAGALATVFLIGPEAEEADDADMMLSLGLLDDYFGSGGSAVYELWIISISKSIVVPS